MKSKSVLIGLLLIMSITAKPCLNVYHALDAKGEFHIVDDAGFVGFNKNFNLLRIDKKLKDLEAKISEEKSPFLLSDYAVLLMKAGKVEESLRLLIALNRNHPKEYKIAANLGTAYELNGNLDSALYYINRGMELNANAHDGSEWVHVRILETKMALEKDSTLLHSRSVLQLSDFDKKDTEIRKQLEIQIRERFPFSPGPNAIMVSLFIDLGDCYAETFSFEYAKAFYTLAQEYYGADEEITKPKINGMIALRREHDAISPPDLTFEGEDIKVGGIRYKDLIDNNNKDNVEINWEEHNLDVPALLALLGYQEYIPAEKDIIESDPDSVLTEDANENVDSESTENSNFFLPIVFTFVAVLLFIVVIRRRNKKQQQAD